MFDDVWDEIRAYIPVCEVFVSLRYMSAILKGHEKAYLQKTKVISEKGYITHCSICRKKIRHRFPSAHTP